MLLKHRKVRCAGLLELFGDAVLELLPAASFGSKRTTERVLVVAGKSTKRIQSGFLIQAYSFIWSKATGEPAASSDIPGQRKCPAGLDQSAT